MRKNIFFNKRLKKTKKINLSIFFLETEIIKPLSKTHRYHQSQYYQAEVRCPIFKKNTLEGDHEISPNISPSTRQQQSQLKF